MEVLTDKMITEARAGEIHHPIIDIFSENRAEIQRVQHELDLIDSSDAKRRSDYITENYGFLATAIVRIGEFPLTPANFVGIWATDTIQSATTLERYAYAKIIISAYISAGNNDGWKDVSSSMLAIGELPSNVRSDYNGLRYAEDKLADITEIELALSAYYGAHSSSPLGSFILSTLENIRGGKYVVQSEIGLMLSRLRSA